MIRQAPGVVFAVMVVGIAMIAWTVVYPVFWVLETSREVYARR